MLIVRSTEAQRHNKVWMSWVLRTLKRNLCIVILSMLPICVDRENHTLTLKDITYVLGTTFVIVLDQCLRFFFKGPLVYHMLRDFHDLASLMRERTAKRTRSGILRCRTTRHPFAPESPGYSEEGTVEQVGRQQERLTAPSWFLISVSASQLGSGGAQAFKSSPKVVVR